MRIIIGEEDVLVAKDLKEIVELFGNEVVGIGKNKEDIIRMIDQYIPDLLLQDINRDQPSVGIEVGQYVLENYSFPHIYLTANTEIGIVEEALKTKPVGYIIKPFIPVKIYSAIQIALDHFRDHHEHEILTIKDGYSIVKLPYYTIKYLKSDNIYVEIHTSKKVFIIRESLDKIFQMLDKNLFIRTHRSYIIHRHHIKYLESSQIWINGTSIPISRKYLPTIRSIFI